MDYEIQYSKRKTVSISVKDGNLIVKAPYKTDKAKLGSLLSKHRRWIEKHLEISRMNKKVDDLLTDDRIKILREAAKLYLKRKVEYYSNIMNLKYGRITITGAKTRFGSCSSKGNLSFSYRLMLYPEEAREYVVVHELAHLKEMNHSPRFYAIVQQYLPDYKERRKLLKQVL